MSLESIIDDLGTGKQVGIFALGFLAVTTPTIFGQIPWFREVEPAWGALLVGTLTAIIGFFVFRYGYQEFTYSTMLSASVLMGLISAHVAVFHITEYASSVATYLIFLFVFYWDLSEGSVSPTGAAGVYHHHKVKRG